MRSDQHSWCKNDRVNRPVQLIYHSGTYARLRCWLRDVNQLKPEAADHQVSGLGFYKVRNSTIETQIGHLDERQNIQRLSSILEVKSWEVLT